MTFLLFAAAWILSLGWLLITLCYFLGQFANFALHAHAVITSPNADVKHIDTMGVYLARYWPKLLVRFLWNTIIVIVVAIVPKVFFPNYSLDVQIANLSPGVALLLKCAAVCGAGLMADVIIKKVRDVLKSKGVDVSEAIPESPGQTVAMSKEEVDKAVGRGNGS